MDGTADMVAWERVIALAKGCTDYGGGHSGECAEAFQHGIWTVGNALKRAREHGGTPDLQLRVVESIGRDVQSLTARLEVAEAERDEARRILLALSDAADRESGSLWQALADALGVDMGPPHAAARPIRARIAAALRKVCGVSDG